MRGKKTSPCPSRSLGVFSAAGVRRAADGSLRVRELQSAGSLCESSLRCTRALPYPGSPVGDFFFVTRAFQPEQRAAIFLSPWCSFSRVSGPLTPDPSPPAGARGGFCWCILWCISCISWTAFCPCGLSAAPPPDPCAESQLPDCQLPAACRTASST